MYASFTKEVSEDHISELQKTIQKGEPLQGSVINPIKNGVSTEIFKLTTPQTDENPDPIEYSIIPLIQSTTVKNIEQKQKYEAIIYNKVEEITKFLSFQLVTDCITLPTIVQTFYRGEESDRNSNFEYVFYDDDRYPAVKAKQQIKRPNTNIRITDITNKGGHFPQIWDVKDEYTDTIYLLRERSGKIQLRKQGQKTPLLQIFVGTEYPGIPLSETEVFELLSSINEISVEATVNQNS